MKKRTLILMAGAAAAGAVGALQGLGPFNKIKFKNQHDAVSRYVQTHYPHALYSPISQTKSGWLTVIRRLNMPPIMLYITLSPDGSFVFKEVASGTAQ
ncbi:MAG: hypothetical protein LUD03_03195 [Firmicutes bacterium]|nr:hypothetical protein [Bacillota bacterium]